jgi:hypothetical protein
MNKQQNSSCSLQVNAKRKTLLWLVMIAVTSGVGFLLGSAYSGLLAGIVLGLPLFFGGG